MAKMTVDLMDLKRKMGQSEGERLYQLMELEAEQEGKILFAHDVVEGDEMQEVIEGMENLSEDQKDMILVLAAEWAESSAREGFVTGYDGINKKSRSAGTLTTPLAKLHV